MSYSIRFTNGQSRTGVAGGEACVALTPPARAILSRAGVDLSRPGTLAGGVFTFDKPHGGVVRIAASSFASTTLAALVAGCDVLIDDGAVSGGGWRAGTVTIDDAGGTSSGGTTFPSATVAYALLADSSPMTPTDYAGARIALVGTASDGSVWFTVGTGRYHFGAATTVGALASRTVAIALLGDGYHMMTQP